MSAIDSLRSKGELEPPYPQKTSKAIKEWYALQTPEVKAQVEARVRELIERKKFQYGEFYKEPVDDPITYAGQKILIMP
jgi:hypothetical protein